MRINPKSLRLYAVTDRAWTSGTDGLLKQVEAAIRGGAGFVQLREKTLPEAEFLEEARRVVALCKKCGVLCVINDNVEVAIQAGADGVHVGQEDLEASRARARLGPDKLIGVSAHTVEEALRAQAAGADYLGTGAAFATGTKQDAGTISKETIREICRAVSIPVVAIGGITKENILELAGLGLEGAAVVSALFAPADVERAARELLPLCEKLAEN